MDTVYPTLPSTACLVASWSLPNADGSTRRRYWQINFAIAGDFPVLSTVNTFVAATVPWLNPLMSPLWGGLSQQTVVQWVLNTPTRLRQTRQVYPWSIGAGYFPQVDASNIPIFLESAWPGRRGTGRLAFPFIRDGDFEASRVTSAARSRLSNLCEFYTTTTTILGVSFTPCVWSRLDATFRPIVRTRIAGQVSYMQKRIPKVRKEYTVNHLPELW
jgi:hypothetical protein